jgi:hypothetical protein
MNKAWDTLCDISLIVYGHTIPLFFPALDVKKKSLLTPDIDFNQTSGLCIYRNEWMNQIDKEMREWRIELFLFRAVLEKTVIHGLLQP